MTIDELKEKIKEFTLLNKEYAKCVVEMFEVSNNAIKNRIINFEDLDELHDSFIGNYYSLQDIRDALPSLLDEYMDFDRFLTCSIKLCKEHGEKYDFCEKYRLDRKHMVENRELCVRSESFEEWKEKQNRWEKRSEEHYAALDKLIEDAKNDNR